MSKDSTIATCSSGEAALLAFIEWLHKNYWLIGGGGGTDKRKWLVKRFLKEQAK